MRHKMTALLVPLILLLSGVGAATGGMAADGDVQAPSAGGGAVTLFIIGQDFFLKTNESEYVNYKYEIVWKVDGEDLVPFVINDKVVGKNDGGTSATVNGVRYTLIQDSAEGLYKVSTARATECDGEGNIIPPADATLTWKVQICIDGVTKDLDTKRIVLHPADTASVYVRPFATSMPYVGQVYNKEMEATIVSGANELSIVGTKVGDVDKGSAVTWYAIGLPEGLSMSSDGHINGVAKNYTSMDEPAKVNVAISYEGAVYTGTFYIYTQGTQSSEFMMYVDGMEISNDGFFMGIKGSGNVLVIKDEGGAVIGDSRLIVNTVNIDGRISSLGRDGDGYVLPDIGTGAYLVTVTMMDELNLLKPITKSFTFYSLPPGAIAADIIVSGG